VKFVVPITSTVDLESSPIWLVPPFLQVLRNRGIPRYFFCMMTSMSRDRQDFTPVTLLRNPHVMTVLPGRWPRRALLAGVPTESRLFTTEPHTQLLGFCHWQPHRTACQTVVLVHGLEGSSESHYMRGIASKAYRAGFNVIRMNQRTCGGTEHLTPTLYNSGLSQDYRTVVQELARVDGLTHIWLVGLSDHRSVAMRQSFGSASELGLSLSLFDSTQTAFAAESEALSRQVGSHRTGWYSRPQ
jgi:hypothetical protein